MKKLIISFIAVFISLTMTAQVPYFAGTVGEGLLYGYSSMKIRPGINLQETYHTFQYGLRDRIQTGVDLYTSPGYEAWGYLIRGQLIQSDYFNLGLQITPSFDLTNSHKFAYNTTGLYMNGGITPNLFWVSNTWWVWNPGGNHTFNQWWYLGYTVGLNIITSITPMIGLIHNWNFNEDPTPAVGVYLSRGDFNFYVWTDKWIDNNPRIVIGVDFRFDTNLF